MTASLLARAMRESELQARQIWITQDVRGRWYLRLAAKAGETLRAVVIGKEVFYH